MQVSRSRFFLSGVFVAYVAFAAIIAGAAAPVAGMVLLVVGIMVAVTVEHMRWHAEELSRLTLARPFRPDPHGLGLAGTAAEAPAREPAREPAHDASVPALDAIGAASGPLAQVPGPGDPRPSP